MTRHAVAAALVAALAATGCGGGTPTGGVAPPVSEEQAKKLEAEVRKAQQAEGAQQRPPEPAEKPPADKEKPPAK